MNDTLINNRQQKILLFLFTNQKVSRIEIEKSLKDEKVSRITIIRDLNHLINLGLVKQGGGGKYVTYSLEIGKELLIPVDLNEFFEKNSDAREILYPTFNPKIIGHLHDLLTEKEIELFERGKKTLLTKFAKLDPSLLKRELDRFTIELAWKSSQIEGNTYSLLETEELIKNNKEAEGHDSSEAVMILNHKKTFDIILENRDSFKEISMSDIQAIHAELVRDLEITIGFREAGVGITGTKYVPLDNQWQIDESLRRVVEQSKNVNYAPEKAIISLAMISYLQPFNDGNKRTSRMVSNALLLSNGYYPLSYRSVDEVEYKKALIVFYEQNNIHHLKRIFIEQQRFAIETYFI